MTTTTLSKISVRSENYADIMQQIYAMMMKRKVVEFYIAREDNVLFEDSQEFDNYADQAIKARLSGSYTTQDIRNKVKANKTTYDSLRAS